MDHVLQPLYARAQAAMQADDHPEMIRVGDAILARNPADAIGLVSAGAAFLREQRFGLAAQLLGAASKARPHDAELWNNFGCALQEWHPKDALHCLEQSMRADPELDAPVQNCVGVLSTLGRFADAVAIANDYLGREPDDPDVNHNAALAYMQLGRWADAWACWAKTLGKKRPERMYLGRDDRAVRAWTGEQPTVGRDKIVIYGEQGIGDEILAASKFNQAIGSSGAEIVIECDPRLEAIFARSFPDASVHGTLLEEVAPWERAEAVTHKIASMDLFGMYAPEPFRHAAYLRADPALRAMFRGLLDTLGDGLKVGIAWSGGVKDWDRAQRCIDPVLLGPIVNSPNCQFVCLEYDAPAGLPANVHDFRWAVARGVDFDLTAALIAELDLVITVPQTCVDAAGALGTPCWVLTPPVPQWRFAEAAGDTAWVYQGVEILRRQGPFWQGAIGQAAQRLRVMAETPTLYRRAAE